MNADQLAAEASDKLHGVRKRDNPASESDHERAMRKNLENWQLQSGQRVADAHNATQQSADTKRREWIEHVRPTITFDINGCEIFGLSGNFCIGKGKTFIEAIDDAMSQTKDGE